MSKRVFYHGGVADSAALIIVGSSSTRTIDAATVVNYSASAATLTLWQVPNAGSRADTNLMLDALSIAAGASVSLNQWLSNHAISQNASIHAEASAATSLTLIVSGREQ